MQILQDYNERARKLRDSPMVKAWITAYQTDKWSTHKDCHRCGYPHSPHVLCGMGASFGTLWLGRDHYSVDFSNVVFFHDFMLKISEGRGFHWRDETFFTRTGDGSVEVHYLEQYNNTPQQKMWRIPPNAWASIVASVSATGETSESYREAVKFHGAPPSPSEIK